MEYELRQTTTSGNPSEVTYKDITLLILNFLATALGIALFSARDVFAERASREEGERKE